MSDDQQLYDMEKHIHELDKQKVELLQEISRRRSEAQELRLENLKRVDFLTQRRYLRIQTAVIIGASSVVVTGVITTWWSLGMFDWWLAFDAACVLVLALAVYLEGMYWLRRRYRRAWWRMANRHRDRVLALDREGRLWIDDTGVFHTLAPGETVGPEHDSAQQGTGV